MFGTPTGDQLAAVSQAPPAALIQCEVMSVAFATTGWSRIAAASKAADRVRFELR
ncbi:MAG: hypothetical protein IPM94_08215 [bacterium]|nr:hypothetical protein [bacterium]